jgi:hypothetical protein
MPEVTPYAAIPAPSGIAAYGTQIQVLTSAPGVTPETYASIAGVGDITGPATQVAEVETTSHSTGSPHKTFIPSLIDDGNLSFKMYWHPSDPTQSPTSPYGLQYLFQNRIVTKFRIINTDANHQTRIGYGFVKQLNESYPVAGLCEIATVIRVSGPFQVVTSAILLTPTSVTGVLAAGGPATYTVAAGGSVTPWNATPDVPWITVTAPTLPATGDNTVNYTVAVNAVGNPARTGHINMPELGLVFTVSQVAG